MRIETAEPEDAEQLLALRRAAFAPVAEQYNDPDMPPMRETLEHVLEETRHCVVLKATEAERIVGSARACERNGVVHIGRLAVAPEDQGRGIGTALASAIIDQFPGARAFELFTGHKSAAPLAVYRKLGFEIVREERESDDLTLLHLQRPGPAAQPVDRP